MRISSGSFVLMFHRKAVKATLVLVPLFGLHFGITMYRPQSGICQWQELYIYLDILLDGLQGAVVALIFCYVNGEVMSLSQIIKENIQQVITIQRIHSHSNSKLHNTVDVLVQQYGILGAHNF